MSEPTFAERHQAVVEQMKAEIATGDREIAMHKMAIDVIKRKQRDVVRALQSLEGSRLSPRVKTAEPTEGGKAC